MKLHRLIMTNYRGVAHREIEFPDQGVVIIHGANEIGKSSMIEALDLLLESKDRSTKKEVKQVKPTNADVGAEVSAEISSGPYRFTYRKRFHKRPETELTVLAPHREQFTGDEAHDRVRTMLAETVDTELWHAQRVLQAASTCAVDLAGCDALSRALDVAADSAGDAALSGSEPVLIERIDAEFARYFTATGRPTGEWAAAIARLDAAKLAVAECTQAMAEVDDRVARHAELGRESAELAQLRTATVPRLAAAQAAADRVAALSKELKDAGLVAAAALATSITSHGAHAARLALIAEIDSRSRAVAAVSAEAQEAVRQQATASAEAKTHEGAVEEAVRALAAAQQRAEAAQRTLDWIAEREEADRLSALLSRFDEAQRQLDSTETELSGIVLNDELWRRIETAAAAVDRIGGQLELISAVVEFTACTDIEIAVDGQRVALSAGEAWQITATAPTDVEVPGVLTARVTSGATALDIHTKHVAAQRDLTEALTAAGVADLTAARSVEQRRHQLAADRDRLAATLAALCGDDQPDALRARLAHLQVGDPSEPDLFTTDAGAARAERDAAEAARVAAQATCEARRRCADDASRRLAETTTRATVLNNNVAAQRAELDAAVSRLAADRATVSDQALATTADAERQTAHAAELRVVELDRALADAAPDSIAAELAEATKAVDSLDKRHAEVVAALNEVSIELAVLSSEGRKGKLDAAQTELKHAASQHTRVGDRARAAQLLRSVMTRHRDTSRLRYVAPYRTELQRLGRPVFGSSFEVEVDSALRIVSRTLNGTTVPYESLSGGAKEQLGILARLAGAALVAKEDTVPVVVDDALGFTDPDRLAKMSEVFDTVGAHGQVIVLTCSPTRYGGVTGAHRIDLSA
ncbi:AAA family ATPase [Mycobacterium vicinigordonae]|uniref:AAA family ATPase n=1 Tax=Mycobacterium vicinigordonae TaxID=1719132 RepID=A0A7D6HMW8_9MYCO|nr:AAA family ATPase [Mycobacterium vicinigordonae]QLL06191.1 AAA family ATPase [Mycobacterium vicinigordonae]